MDSLCIPHFSPIAAHDHACLFRIMPAFPRPTHSHPLIMSLLTRYIFLHVCALSSWKHQIVLYIHPCRVSMHIIMHTCARMPICSHVRARTSVHTRACIPPCRRTSRRRHRQMQAHVCTCADANTDADADADATQPQTWMRTQTRTRTQTQMQKQTQTHTHTCMQKHMLIHTSVPMHLNACPNVHRHKHLPVVCRCARVNTCSDNYQHVDDHVLHVCNIMCTYSPLQSCLPFSCAS